MVLVELDMREQDKVK